jgi:DNA mismatch repair protein MutL
LVYLERFRYNIKEMILDLADNLIAMEDTLPIEDKIRKICASISCHGSIRAGRAMKLEEMNTMLRQMEENHFLANVTMVDLPI